jgi:polysaccharide pyruvyl transferase WcaK-like protein
MYGHGGSYNHGAEAIVKMTIRAIREEHADAYILLSSNFPEQDHEFEVDADKIFAPNLIAWETEKSVPLNEKERYARLMYADALDAITPVTTLYSIGGDNFCYPQWHRLSVFQHKAAEISAKSVLWSCSIEPSSITPEMLTILNSYDLITARESITFDALKERGFTGKLRLVKDIAFGLPPEKVALSQEFSKNNFVGINISPLVMRRETEPGIVMENFRNLILHIILKSNLNIALIPYVLMPMDNDFAALQNLYLALPENILHRVWLVSDKLSAAQYKFIISQSKTLICCRTHASIAAYSSNVPCIVVGYSVKSIGIAKDLGAEDFVLPVNKITSGDMITRLLNRIY